MKPGPGIIKCKMLLYCLVLLMISPKLFSQVSIGILPVQVPAGKSQVLNDNQWQNVSFQLYDFISTKLAEKETVTRLTREHILLLLKEVPSPDPENLGEEAYRIISRKEKIEYLLKCSIEPVLVQDRDIIAPLTVILYDGHTGKLFWTKAISPGGTLPSSGSIERMLLEEIFKPNLNEISKEIKELKL